MMNAGEIAKDLVALVDGKQTAAGYPVDGDLISKYPERPLNFGFEYQGIPFVIRAESKDQGTRLEIRANLGHLPFTAESAERRATALAILNAATLDLGGRMRLTRKQQIIMIETYHLDEPLTPAALLSRTVRIVLRTKPYLELMSLVVRPPIVRTAYASSAIN